MTLLVIVFAGILTMWVPSRWALTAFQVAVLLTAMAVLARRISSGQRIATDPTAAVIAGIVVWCGAQLIFGWTVVPFRTEEQMLHWLVVLSAFAVTLVEADDPRLRDRMLTLVLLFATVLSILATVTVFSSPPGVIAWTWDVGTKVPTLGPFVYRNQWAAFVETVLPIALLRGFASRDHPWLYAIAAGLLFSSVIAAGSRTGAILCGAELLVIPVICVTRGFVPVRTLLGAGAAVGLSIIGLTLTVGWGFLWARFQEPNPFSLRWDLIQSSMEMFRARPLTGWGMGTWADVYPGFARYDDGSYVNQAHSDWAQWAAEGGVVVVAALGSVLFRALRSAAQTVWGWGLVAVFVHALVDYPFQQRPAIAVFFLVMLGLAFRGKGRD